MLFLLFLLLPLSSALSQTTLSPQANLTASDGRSFCLFGSSVAASGSLVVIGAVEDLYGLGSAYLFDCSFFPCMEVAKLTAPAGKKGDEFGYSVAISGSLVVVGAPGNGSAYLFICSALSCTHVTKLTQAAPRFGFSVAISGPLLVVGSEQLISKVPGTAYLYNCTSLPPVRVAKLNASDVASGARFGSSVSVSGSLVAIGAPGESQSPGSVHLYDCTSSLCPRVAKLSALSASQGDYFGISVALSGSLVVVGAPGGRTAYLFDCSSLPCTKPIKIVASQARGFGGSVAITGPLVLDEVEGRVAVLVVVGAPGDNTASLFGCSSARCFGIAGLHPPGNVRGLDFAQSVAISGPLMVVGDAKAEVRGQGRQGSALVALAQIACNGNPCKNGGKCAAVTLDKIQCFCPPWRFTGPTCETDLLLISGILLGFAFVVTTYMILRHCYPASDNLIILTMTLSIYDFVTDSLFVNSQSIAPNSIFFKASLSFLILPTAFNLAALAYVYMSILLPAADSRTWLSAHPLLAAATTVLGSTNAEILTLLKSRLLNLKNFAAPFPEQALLFIASHGLMGKLLEDVPQLVIQVLVASRNGVDTFLLLSITGSVVSLSFELLKRVIPVFVARLLKAPKGGPGAAEEGEAVLHQTEEDVLYPADEDVALSEFKTPVP